MEWKYVIPPSVAKYIHILNTVPEGSYQPSKEDVFKAFRLCPFDKCRVVILGQDPYPQDGIATGLAFANKETQTVLSPSLEVIKKSVLSMAGKGAKFDQTLESWEKQGILLLNSSLTVKTNAPGSHAEIWKPFMRLLIENMSLANPKIFWILFGKQAWEFEECIKGKTNNVITEFHPAYFARANIPMGNWMWTKMLNYINETNKTKDAEDLLLWF